MRLNKKLKLGIFALASVLLSVSVKAQLAVEDGFVRGMPPGQPTTAAFFTLHNDGSEKVTIVEVVSDSAKVAEIHRHLHKNGMMSMQKVERLEIPAKTRFEFSTGGHHLILIGLHKALREGDKVTVEFVTDSGRTVAATLPVRSVLNEPHH
mgnify:CR=1 FL=1